MPQVGIPTRGMPMGVDISQDLAGNPAAVPNANAGGLSSTTNIGGTPAGTRRAQNGSSTAQ